MGMKKEQNGKFEFEYFTPETVYGLSKIYLFAAAFIHALMAGVFFYSKVTTLGIINVISFLVYMSFGFVITYKTIRKIYCFVILEIMFFIIICVMTFRWQYDFHLYSFTIISLGILTSISPKDNKYNIKYPLVIFLAGHLILLVLRIYHFNNPIDIQYDFSKRIEALYGVIAIINYIFVTCALFMPLLAFVIDLRKASRKIDAINNELDFISTHDALTGLINRRSMDEIIKGALYDFKKEDKAFSMILSDIDDFKKVNDTYGHNVGDYVLKKVSQMIEECVEDAGSVCRWGGEEIMILFDGKLEEAVNIAEIIRKTVEKESFQYEDYDFAVTMTFGVAEYDSKMDINELIVKADDNMYKGKKTTKNCVIA